MDHADINTAIAVRAIAVQLREAALAREAPSFKDRLDSERWKARNDIASFVPAALDELKSISDIINRT